METGQLATVMFCEKTSTSTASNYRGELIGGVRTTLSLIALTDWTKSQSKHTLEIYCDNLGAVFHGNTYLRFYQNDTLSMMFWPYYEGTFLHFQTPSGINTSMGTKTTKLPFRILRSHNN